jgi:hypothetical protein
MCPRLLFIFNHNKKYSKQQNGIVEKNNYLLVQNVQVQACYASTPKSIILVGKSNHCNYNMCEGMIKYRKKLCIAKSSLQMIFFDTNKNLYIFISFI